jgi:hypothetical protein
MDKATDAAEAAVKIQRNATQTYLGEERLRAAVIDANTRELVKVRGDLSIQELMTILKQADEDSNNTKH